MRATVRTIANATDFAAKFPSVTLFEADLLKEGSFDACFDGADFVLHTASPFQLNVQDAQKELIEPAVNGTINVLSSVEKFLGKIKAVVVTSSVAAVVPQSPDSDKVYDESDWNTTSSLTNGPYRLSKYLAETAAWDWWKGKEDKIKLVTVNPAFVLGRLHLARKDSTSIRTVMNMLNGVSKGEGLAGYSVACVDIRNVAEAHIACIENEKSHGRYLLCGERSVYQMEYADILRKHFGQYPLPDKYKEATGPGTKFNNKKAVEELGITLVPLEDTLVEMANSILDQNLVDRL